MWGGEKPGKDRAAKLPPLRTGHLKSGSRVDQQGYSLSVTGDCCTCKGHGLTIPALSPGKASGEQQPIPHFPHGTGVPKARGGDWGAWQDCGPPAPPGCAVPPAWAPSAASLSGDSSTPTCAESMTATIMLSSSPLRRVSSGNWGGVKLRQGPGRARGWLVSQTRCLM